MKRSALPLVRGVYARVRRCRRPRASQAVRHARESPFPDPGLAEQLAYA